MSADATPPADFAAPGGWTAPGKEPSADCNGSRGLVGAGGALAFPAMSEYETKVFRRFARGYEAKYHQHSIQLEGDKQLPKVAAAFRLMKKGILMRPSACHWYLTELGKKMALEWQRQKAGGGGAEHGDGNGAQQSGAVPSIDPKLSDTQRRRDACAAGSSGAGGVTERRVRWSAWLGVAVIWVDV